MFDERKTYLNPQNDRFTSSTMTKLALADVPVHNSTPNGWDTCTEPTLATPDPLNKQNTLNDDRTLFAHKFSSEKVPHMRSPFFGEFTA